MAEEVYGRPHMEPLHAFPDGLLPIHACFLWSMSTIPLPFFDRGPPNHEKEASGESLRGFFYERMT